MANERLDAKLEQFLQWKAKKRQWLQARAEGTLEEGDRIDFSELARLIESLTAMVLLDKDAPCESCSYFAEVPEMVCALHPEGPEGSDCPDFEDWQINKS